MYTTLLLFIDKLRFLYYIKHDITLYTVNKDKQQGYIISFIVVCAIYTLVTY